MALFKPFRGTRAALETLEKHDGYAYFCVDDGSFHIDYVDDDGNLQRKQINAKEAESLIGVDISDFATKEDIEELTPATYTSRYNDFLITPKGSAHLDEATEPAIGSGSGWHRIHIGQRRAPGTLDISLMHRYWGPAVQNLSIKFSGFVDWPENNNTGKIKPTMYQFYNCYYGPEAYDANDVHAKITKARLGWGDPTATDAIANPMLCYVDVYVELDDEHYKTKYDAQKTKSAAAQCEIGLTAIFYGDANKSGTYPILSEKESIYHTIDGVDYNINEYGARGELLTFHEIEIDFDSDIKLDNLGADRVVANSFDIKKDELVGLNYLGNLEQAAPRGTFDPLTIPENAISALGAFYHKFNMLPYPQYVTDRNGVNGIYVDVDRSGALIIHGTATANVFKPLNAYSGSTGIDVRSDKSFFLPSGTYKASKYLEFQMVYEHDTSTLINNPHTNGSNSFMPTTDTTTMSTFTVDAPGAWVTRTGLRFTKGKTYNNVIFVPYIYPATEDFSIVGDVGFITIQDRKADKLYLIENHKDFYGDTLKIEDSKRMNEIFNRSNHSTLMIRALEQNDIVLHGETSLTVSGAGADVNLSEYAKKDEVSNSLINSKENPGWITITDANPLTKEVIVNTYSAYKKDKDILEGKVDSNGNPIWTVQQECSNGFHVIKNYIESQKGPYEEFTYVLEEYNDVSETSATICFNIASSYGSSAMTKAITLPKESVIYVEDGKVYTTIYDPSLDVEKAGSFIKYGKNLIGIPSKTIEGGFGSLDSYVKLVPNADGSLSVNAAVSLDTGLIGTVAIYSSSDKLPEGAYVTLSGGVPGCSLKFTGKGSVNCVAIDNGGGTTFHLEKGITSYTVSLITTGGNYVIKPQLEIGTKVTELEKLNKTFVQKTTSPLSMVANPGETITLVAQDFNTAFFATYNQDVNDKIQALNEDHASKNEVSNALIGELKNPVVKLENISPLVKEITIEPFNHYKKDKVLVETNEGPSGWLWYTPPYDTYVRILETKTSGDSSNPVYEFVTGHGEFSFNEDGNASEENLAGIAELKVGDVIFVTSYMASYSDEHQVMYLCKSDTTHAIQSPLNIPVSIYKYGKNLCNSDLDIVNMFHGAYVWGYDNNDGTYLIQPEEFWCEDNYDEEELGFQGQLYDIVREGKTLPTDCYVTLSGAASEYLYFRLTIQDNNGNELTYEDKGQGVTFYVPYGYKHFNLKLVCDQRMAYKDYIIKPMIEVGTVVTEFEQFEHPTIIQSSGSLVMPINNSNVTIFSDDYTVCFHVTYNRDINSAYKEHTDRINGVDDVLRQILAAIQGGGTTAETIDTIEQLLVSYLEDKTVEEVEG